MPTRFSFQGREYHWYQGLGRTRKRYMIRLFRENKTQILDQVKPKASTSILWAGVLNWDERTGPQVLSGFPSDKTPPMSVFMQIYANFLAAAGETLIHFEPADYHYSAIRLSPPEDLSLFLIIESRGVDDLTRFDKILIRFQQLLTNKPELAFILDSERKNRYPKNQLEFWVRNGVIQPDFCQKMWGALQKILK